MTEIWKKSNRINNLWFDFSDTTNTPPLCVGGSGSAFPWVISICTIIISLAKLAVRLLRSSLFSVKRFCQSAHSPWSKDGAWSCSYSCPLESTSAECCLYSRAWGAGTERVVGEERILVGWMNVLQGGSFLAYCLVTVWEKERALIEFIKCVHMPTEFFVLFRILENTLRNILLLVTSFLSSFS